MISDVKAMSVTVHTGDKSCRKRRQIVAEAIVAENGNKSCPKRRQIVTRNGNKCCLKQRLLLPFSATFVAIFVAVFGNFCRQCGQTTNCVQMQRVKMAGTRLFYAMVAVSLIAASTAVPAGGNDQDDAAALKQLLGAMKRYLHVSDQTKLSPAGRQGDGNAYDDARTVYDPCKISAIYNDDQNLEQVNRKFPMN